MLLGARAYAQRGACRSRGVLRLPGSCAGRVVLRRPFACASNCSALAPLESTLGRQDPQALRQLKRELGIVVSAEALFTLTDLYGLSADEAIASAVRAARTITAAAVRDST